MTVTYKVGPKGQVVVAKEIRDKLGVEPGWIAIQALVDGHLEVHFLPPEHNDSLAGIFARYVNAENRITDENWDEVRSRAWADAWAARSQEADP